MSFRCVVCGEEHDGLPDLGAEFPDPYLALPFPIHETKDIFGIGAWVSQSHANME